MSFSQRSSEAGTPHYGVKSYLHHFYDDCTKAEICDANGPPVFESTEPKTRPHQHLICCATCIISTIIALSGIVLFLLSLLKPDAQESLSLASDRFYELRLTGAVLFCIGGSSMSVCISWVILNKLNQIKEELENKKFYSRLHSNFTSGDAPEKYPKVETSQPVPLSLTHHPMSQFEVTAIQPPLDDADEVADQPTRP